jgi:hypothetical protein
MAARSANGVTAEPNPPIEGQGVTLTVTGRGPFYMSRDPDGDLIELTPNSDNVIELGQPPGTAGQTFTVTNFGDPPVEGRFTIAPSGGIWP